MSKRENHWYLVGATLQVMAAARRRMFTGRMFLLWVILVFLFIVAWQVSPQAFGPGAISNTTPYLMAAVVIAILGRAFWLRTRYRADLLAALQLPTPEKLMEVLDRSMSHARAHPDVDALTAHAKAIGLALYGQTDEAFRLLAAVPWQARAPLIQAAGVGAESVVELLCRRAPARALELARKARALASVSSGLPGAAQATRFYETCVATAEVLTVGETSTAGLAVLRDASTRPLLFLNLLASFGLAAADPARAGELRQMIAQKAPHCRPLLLGPQAFSTPGTDAPGPVTTALASAPPADAPVQRNRTFRIAGRALGMWALLILAFVAVWMFLNQPPTPR